MTPDDLARLTAPHALRSLLDGVPNLDERAAADRIAEAADADPGEANEPALHDLDGREADHYAGGKPATCPDCAPR